MIKRDVPPTTINYPWIGPPAIPPYEGQDINGPVDMAAVISEKNPIIFWCLPEYKAHYEAVYKEKLKDIPNHDKLFRVCSIDELLDEKSQDTAAKDAIDKFKEMQKVLLDHRREEKRLGQTDDKELNENMRVHRMKRDFVTLKEAFALLLLCLRGDYTLDTNVRPHPNIQFSLHNKFSLPEYTRLQFPILSLENFSKDIWILYNPKNKLNDMKWVFDQFYEAWCNAEVEFKKNGYSESYYREMRVAVTNSLEKFCEIQKYEDDDCWSAVSPEVSENASWNFIIKDLNLVKTLNNTHIELSTAMLMHKARFEWSNNNKENSQRYYRQALFSCKIPHYLWEVANDFMVHFNDTGYAGKIVAERALDKLALATKEAKDNKFQSAKLNSEMALELIECFLKLSKKNMEEIPTINTFADAMYHYLHELFTSHRPDDKSILKGLSHTFKCCTLIVNCLTKTGEQQLLNSRIDELMRLICQQVKLLDLHVTARDYYKDILKFSPNMSPKLVNIIHLELALKLAEIAKDPGYSADADYNRNEALKHFKQVNWDTDDFDPTLKVTAKETQELLNSDNWKERVRCQPRVSTGPTVFGAQPAPKETDSPVPQPTPPIDRKPPA